MKRQIFHEPAFIEFVSDANDLCIFPVSVECFSGWQCTNLYFAYSVFLILYAHYLVAYQYYVVMLPSFVLVKRGHSALTVAGSCCGVVDAQSILMLLRDSSVKPLVASSKNSIDADDDMKDVLLNEHVSEEADDELGSALETTQTPIIGSSASSISVGSSNNGAPHIGDSTSRLLNQQLSDYEVSLAKDRAKEWEKREREAEQARQLQIQQLHECEVETVISKAMALLDANPEPQEEGIKLAVQLPDGKKIYRRFSKDSSCALLYAFVDVHYLRQDSALLDYRLQSIHPSFHVLRVGTLSDYPALMETHHKLYVDLAPVGVTEGESAGAESDVECSSSNK
jgi:hypothetical protein